MKPERAAPEALVEAICQTIDAYGATHKAVTVGDVLRSLERIRHKLTETVLDRSNRN